MDWKRESEMFNNAAGYYDKFRPSYPKEIINILIEQTELKENSNIIEIGAGSGKATELLAGKGFNILCVEPGKDLAAIGNKRFANDSVKFEVSRFENYDLPESFYDVVFAAQSFHWVPQPEGYEKCAYTLKDNGWLAILYNMYVVNETFADKKLLELSHKYGGFADFLSSEECEKRIDSIVEAIESSGLFCKPKVFKKFWNLSYTADEYYGFALTGNRFMQNTDDVKAEAYRELQKLAEENGGKINRPYLCVLYLAQK